MSRKKKTPTTSSSDLPTLRIGSRVRCTDDGVEGRIVWANGTRVKIQWDDGEQVTWKRQALTGRPIEILDAAGEQDQSEAPVAAPVAEEIAPSELPQTESDPMPATAEQAATPKEFAEPTSSAPEQPRAATEGSVVEPVLTAQEQTPAAPADSAPTQVAPANPKRQRKAPAEPKEKKVSALDAAARVLAEENRPMTCQELIEAMAAKGYWASPKGATPAATLYSAILRELTTKGSAARFIKTERGKFAFNAGG